MRAVLFAKATAVKSGGFLATMRASQEPSGAPLRKAHLTTATAPQIKSRRRSRWPILDVAPSRVLPPDDFCLGVSPSQTAKSRPLPKLSAVGASASSAVAQITPMPGIVIRRFAVSSRRARARKSLSSQPICSPSEAMCVSSILQSPITEGGRRSSEPLTASASRAMWTGPLGATTPYSDMCPRSALIACVRYRTSRSRVLNAIPDACFSTLFTATNRIVGRDAASAIASASAASFLLRLTKGFT